MEKIKNKKIKKIKKSWTNLEDNLLKYLVKKNGPEKWTKIAQKLEGREGKQCRERWHNHLNPEINKSIWKEEEEWLLFLLHKNFGNKWAYISSYIPKRTDNTIKNHWNSIMKKKIQIFEEKLTFYIENKENLIKDPFILELINKIQNNEIVKTISKKGRKTKEEYNKMQLIKSDQRFIKSIKTINEEEISIKKKLNFQSTKLKERDLFYNEEIINENLNFEYFNISPNNIFKNLNPLFEFDISNNKDLNYNDVTPNKNIFKNHFNLSNSNSGIKFHNSFKSNKNEDLESNCYNDLCYKLFN